MAYHILQLTPSKLLSRRTASTAISSKMAMAGGWRHWSPSLSRSSKSGINPCGMRLLSSEDEAISLALKGYIPSLRDLLLDARSYCTRVHIQISAFQLSPFVASSRHEGQQNRPKRLIARVVPLRYRFITRSAMHIYNRRTPKNSKGVSFTHSEN